MRIFKINQDFDNFFGLSLHFNMKHPQKKRKKPWVSSQSKEIWVPTHLGKLDHVAMHCEAESPHSPVKYR